MSQPDRPEDRIHQIRRTGDERREEGSIPCTVSRAQGFDGCVQRPLDHHRSAVVERVRKRGVRVHQLEAMFGERQCPEER